MIVMGKNRGSFLKEPFGLLKKCIISSALVALEATLGILHWLLKLMVAWHDGRRNLNEALHSFAVLRSYLWLTLSLSPFFGWGHKMSFGQEPWGFKISGGSFYEVFPVCTQIRLCWHNHLVEKLDSNSLFQSRVRLLNLPSSSNVSIWFPICIRRV